MAAKDRLIMGKKMTMLERARALLRDFVTSRRGNVAMMFGIALVPMMIAVGVGLDFARAAMARSQMREALDAASLAVGSTPNLDQTKAQALAEKYFKANYKGENKADVKVTNFDAKGKVTITATTTVTTTMLKIAHPGALAVGASSTVVWGQTKLWVALVLDNSGSMCQPLNSPCNDTTDTRTKIFQLKAATTTMLDNLSKVSPNAGDVEVGIVPFNRAVDVGTSNPGASWIDWTEWEAPPPNVTLGPSLGPNSNCPFTTVDGNGNIKLENPYGYPCQTNSTNGSTSVKKIPASGMICPGIDDGDHGNSNHRDRYYNGCWDSVIKQTQTATKTDTTPITIKQTCSQTGSGTISCSNQTGYPSNGTTSSNTVTTVTSGYTGDSTNTSTNTATNSTTDGTKNCTGSGNNRKCTWTRTILQTKTDTTVTKTAYGGYTHTWIVNAHSTWAGCVIDRWKNGTGSDVDGYDVLNTAPTTTDTRFPAANLNNRVSATNCMAGNITKLGHVWTDLNTAVTAMQANGSTNQAIGVAHGWQMLTPGDPYGAPLVPSNTTRYIILLSDGLNTQNRWWGDGSTEGTTEDGYIDDRMDKTCTNAKAEGVVIYTLYVHINGGGNSQPLKDCASDSSKYYDLTTADKIGAAFADITKQITNVRIAE
jgi:Flp pilus assembly protein TadG